MSTLGLPEVLNAAYKLNDWLNFYWNFYVVFTGVVIGWVFSSKGWSAPQRWAVTLFYLGFVGVSLHALWGTYHSLNAAVMRLQQLVSTADPLLPVLVAQLGHSDWPVGIGLHVLGDALVVLCIWRFTTRPPEQVGSMRNRP
jgi:hypothetical protein